MVQVVYRTGTDTNPLIASSGYYYNGFFGFRIRVVVEGIVNVIFTGRNEVLAKVIFSEVCVKNSVHGGGVVLHILL